MNRLFHISFLCALLCFAYSVSSQSSYKAFNADNTKYQSIESSEGLQISKIDGMAGMDNFVVYKEIKNLPSTTKDNHKFTLHLEGEWYELVIGNGDDFFDRAKQSILEDNPYEISLPEGSYDIVILGASTDDNWAFVCYDQILIDKDTEITAKMEDAIHKIDIAPVDANNNLLNDFLIDTQIEYYFFMHPSIGMIFDLVAMDWEGGFYLYVNDMGDRNKILITAEGYEPEQNNTYFITMPMIESGVTEDVLLVNKSDEIVHYSQMFNVPKELTKDSYSHRSTIMVFYDFETRRHSWFGSYWWSSVRVHDRDKPYSLYTNLRFNDAPQTGDINLFISPIFFESDDGIQSSGMDDYDIITPFPMAINKNDELMIDFFSKVHGWSFLNPTDIYGIFCNNPLSRVWNKNEFYHEGYRTPHLYHMARNFNAESSPWGLEAQVVNRLLFLGEFGEQKYNHGDVMVTVTGDGKRIYNGRIVKFNNASINNTNCSQYQIEVTNDQVFAYGRKMINHTVIDFDLTKPDANPPTLTMLRVIDDEKISMTVLHPETARLEITAGDITIDFGEGWTDMLYDKKPNLEVSWSVDGEIFYDLPVEEDASKFHLGYGNFFDVSLAPLLEVNLTPEWITIKIVLTDDAGNSQVQILDPLFHYGGPVGIDEILSEPTSNIAYPNPFTGNVNIELNHPVSGEVYLEIYDITGRIIHQQKMNCNQTGTLTWNGSHLKEGIYFYGVYGKEGVVRGKIIKK